jgi:hypothetical protein
MTSVSTIPNVRLRDPIDILAVTPYLMGFHPRDSLVALGLKGKRLTFHLRGDLPPEGATQAVVDELAARFVALFHQQRITAVVLVGYGCEQRVDPVIAALRRLLPARDITVREALRAHGGRWWSYLCTSAACCPPEGTPYEVASSAIAAAATMAGCVALPDRESVVRRLDPPAGFALHLSARASERAKERLLRLINLDEPDDLYVEGRLTVARAFARYGEGGRLDDDELAWLCVLVQLGRVRDAAWARIMDGYDDLPTHEALWTDALRRCDPALAAPLGVLLAYTLWCSGDGMLASVAVERALTADPECSAARLMAEVLQRSLPPEPGRRRRRALSPESPGSADPATLGLPPELADPVWWGSPPEPADPGRRRRKARARGRRRRRR